MKIKKIQTPTQELLRELFTDGKERAPPSMYKTSICSKKLEAFLKLHAEKSAHYARFATELFRIILSPAPRDEKLHAAYCLKAIYMLLKYQGILRAKGLRKEVNLYINK